MTSTAATTPLITLDAQQWAALVNIRAARTMNADTRSKCRAFATAAGVPIHLQVAAHLGKSDAAIQAEVDAHNTTRAALLAGVVR